MLSQRNHRAQRKSRAGKSSPRHETSYSANSFPKDTEEAASSGRFPSGSAWTVAGKRNSSVSSYSSSSNCQKSIFQFHYFHYHLFSTFPMQPHVNPHFFVKYYSKNGSRSFCKENVKKDTFFLFLSLFYIVFLKTIIFSCHYYTT